jgi:hypothetical protein
VHASERNRLENELQRLGLAATDMRDAIGGLEALSKMRSPYTVQSVLETGIAVTYARPFSPSDGGRRLGPEWKPTRPSLLRTHEMLISRRNVMYAHTDASEKSGRVMHNLEQFGLPARYAAVAFVGWRYEDRARVRKLLTSQEERFSEALTALMERLHPEEIASEEPGAWERSLFNARRARRSRRS